MKNNILFISLLLATGSFCHAQCTDCGGASSPGTNASAIGTNTIASGHSAFASGFGAEATAFYSTAIGFYASASYTKAVAIGSAVRSNKDRAMVIGAGSYSAGKYLENNIERSLVVGFNSTKPTLFIGESPSAALFDKTGRVGIGNMTNPQEKLHIRADAGEAAAIFIEPDSWTLGAQSHIWLGNKANGLTADYRGGMIFHSQADYLFNDGKVGIGTGESLPETTLDVAGTSKMTGLRLQNQSAQAGRVLSCSGINGEAVWQDPLAFSVWQLNEQDAAYRMSRVGIGTQTPQTELDVNGNITLQDAIGGTENSRTHSLLIAGSSNPDAAKILLWKGSYEGISNIKLISPAVGGDIQFHTGGHYNAVMRLNEFVVGFPNNPVALKVNGKIWSHEVAVDITDWWDEVFETNYELLPLSELEKFIETEHHLPEIPTEAMVREEGLELGNANALLLKKIEELTLYTIAQQKLIDQLRLEFDQKMDR